jgi:hypothetical protein
MSVEKQEIINPNFTPVSNKIIKGINMIQCNKSSDVYKFIRKGKKYVIELPESKTILNVECTYSAIKEADMKINSVYINDNCDSEFDEYIFSYQYENFDSIHYTSFSYREKCIVYISINDLI